MIYIKFSKVKLDAFKKQVNIIQMEIDKKARELQARCHAKGCKFVWRCPQRCDCGNAANLDNTTALQWESSNTVREVGDGLQYFLDMIHATGGYLQKEYWNNLIESFRNTNRDIHMLRHVMRLHKKTNLLALNRLNYVGRVVKVFLHFNDFASSKNNTPTHLINFLSNI